MIHIGDIHIKQPSTNTDWWLSRYNKFIDELPCDDVLIISGDIFDSVPTYTDVLLFIHFLISTNDKYNKIVIVEGNHDYKGLKHFLFEILEQLSPLFKIAWSNNIFTFIHNDIKIVCANHSNKDNLQQYEGDVLITHLRCNIKYAKEEYPLDTLIDKYKLILLGDIHNLFNYKANIYYSTSPYRIHKKTIKTLKDIDNSLYGYNIVENLDIKHKELLLPNIYVIKGGQNKIEEYKGNLILHQKVLTHQTNVKQNTEEVIEAISNDFYNIVLSYIKKNYKSVKIDRVLEYLRKFK